MGIVAAALIVAFTLPGPRAEAGSDWSPPALLYQTTDQVVDPSVSTDQEGAIHVFWVDRLSDPRNGEANARIMYSSNRQGRWTTPTDVVDMSGASAPTAAVDRTGTLSLIWHQTSGNLFRSAAPVESADRAAAWATPTNVQSTNASSDVVAGANGSVFLVYPGKGSSGVSFQSSADGGKTWSFPTTVAPAAPGSSSDYTRIAIGPDGTLHVVWTEFQLPNGWPPDGIFYARSTDGGKTWSTPLQVAQTGFNQGSVAAGPNGEVFIAWNGMSGVQGRYSRRSADLGLTWSDPTYWSAPKSTVMTVGGSTGLPGLVIDGAGIANVLFVEDNRVWYSSWNNPGWSAPEYLPSGDERGMPPINQPIDAKTRHIEQAVMAINRGNDLVVVFWDERPGMNRLWALTKAISASEAEILPFTTAVPLPSPTAVASHAASDPIVPSDHAALGPRAVPSDVRLTTMLSMIPVFLIVGSFIVARVWASRR